jgi:2-octaprenylphenol hydroxylase
MCSLDKRLIELNEADFKLELARAFDYRLGEIIEVSKRMRLPLYHRHAQRYVTHRVALIGDAAHTLHPLAGEACT